MPFKKDQTVKVKHPYREIFIDGTVLSELEPFGNDSKTSYWVQFPIDNDQTSVDVSIFYEEDLVEWNKELKTGKCTCGAKYTSTGLHSNWCDSGYNF